MTTKSQKVAIRRIVDEFRNIHQALQRYSMDKKKAIDVSQLLSANSTEEALRQQGILGDAEIDFISALARAERESSNILKAPPGQKRGKKLSE
jgi:hypothetical protein